MYFTIYGNNIPLTQYWCLHHIFSVFWMYKWACIYIYSMQRSKFFVQIGRISTSLGMTKTYKFYFKSNGHLQINISIIPDSRGNCLKWNVLTIPTISMLIWIDDYLCNSNWWIRVTFFRISALPDNQKDGDFCFKLTDTNLLCALCVIKIYKCVI